MKRYTVWMSFEANIKVDADSEDTALEKANAVLQSHSVTHDETGEVNYDFVEQEPRIIETQEL